MTPVPYLTVTEFEAELALRKIECPITVRPGPYQVRLDNAWVELYAVEPRTSTGAAPVRAVVLRGAGAAVESLVRLEAVLRSTGGLVTWKARAMARSRSRSGSLPLPCSSMAASTTTGRIRKSSTGSRCPTG